MPTDEAVCTASTPKAKSRAHKLDRLTGVNL
jgi:hypothetical protein